MIGLITKSKDFSCQKNLNLGELARIGLVNKDYLAAQLIKFDPRKPTWMENRVDFKLIKFTLFLFSMITLFTTLETTTGFRMQTDNLWANSPVIDPTYEYVNLSMSPTHYDGNYNLKISHLLLTYNQKAFTIKTLEQTVTLARPAVPHFTQAKKHSFGNPVITVKNSRLKSLTIELQKRYFIELLTNNETISWHQRNVHMYTSRFQQYLYEETILSRSKVIR